MALIHHIPLKRTGPWIEQDLAAVVDDEQSGDDNNLMGTPGEGYYIEVSIGNPPQQVNILCYFKLIYLLKLHGYFHFVQ